MLFRSFDMKKARELWPDVMEVMDFHGITSLMECDAPYSPDLLREFYAIVYFSTEFKREMTWMSVGVKCEASLAEFGLFGIEELPFSPMAYIRIHVDETKLIKAHIGIRHCYPPGTGLSVIPKVTHMTPFWKAVHSILRHTIAVKYGEKGEVRKWMVNLLFHIVSAKKRGKKIDVLDYMWQEMHSVVLENKVPIYGQYLQKLINTKLPLAMLTCYVMVKPPYLSLPAPTPVENVAAVPPLAKRARSEVSEGGPSSYQEAAHDEEVAHVAAPKKKHILKSIFQKMNCFFVDHQDKGFKAYTKQKAYNRNQREIMKKLELPYPASSEELTEAEWKSKNTYWLGDDATSLGPFWPGNLAASSSGQATGDGAPAGGGDFGHNDYIE